MPILTQFALFLFKAIADEKATKTGWYFSVMPRINIHLRDYEYEIIPHYWPEAVYIAKPKS